MAKNLFWLSFNPIQLLLKYWNIAVSTISDLSDIMPLIFFLIYGLDKLRILQIYFLLSFLIKSTTVILVFFFGSPNTHPFYHVLAVVEVTTLFLYYKKVISWKGNGPKVMLAFLLLFNVLASVMLQSLWAFNSIAWSVNTLSLLFLSITYLYVLYSKAENVALESHPGFVINDRSAYCWPAYRF